METSILERKLNIIGRVAALNDEQLLMLIENLLFDETETLDNDSLSEEESVLLGERVAAYHANPNDETPWEEVKSNLKAHYALRG